MEAKDNEHGNLNHPNTSQSSDSKIHRHSHHQHNENITDSSQEDSKIYTEKHVSIEDEESQEEINISEVREKIVTGIKNSWKYIQNIGSENEESSHHDEFSQKRLKAIAFFKRKKDWVQYIVLGIILWYGAKIRLGNLPLLKDVTTGKYVPLALDPHVFIKYAQYIVDHGFLPAVDPTRFVPVGRPLIDLKFLSYTIAYMYKIVHFFDSSVTLDYIGVLYPVVGFVAAMIVFFLLIRRLFDNRVALLATLLLSIAPSFLYRTMAGFADKESLGTFFMFTALYFYVVGWQSKGLPKIIFFGILSGVFTGFMGLVWGGWKFLLLIMGIYAMAEFFLNKIEKSDFYQYGAWIVTVYIIMVPITGRFTTETLFVSMTSGMAFLVFFILFVDYILFKLDIFKIGHKMSEKAPHSLISLAICVVVGLVSAFVVLGPSYFGNLLTDISNNLLRPLGTNRWMLTVAEQHQPYFVQWRGQFGPIRFNSIPIFFSLFYLGSILLFYKLIKPLKARYSLTALYVFFISAFIFSRYSQSSLFNGTNTISVILYIGSLLLFVTLMGGYYLYSFYKDRDTYHKVTKLDKKYVLLLVWFVIMVVAARGAIRLFFVLAPIGAVLGSYFTVNVITKLYNISHRINDKLYSRSLYAILIIFILLVFWPFGGFVNSIPVLNKVPVIKDNGLVIEYALSSFNQGRYTGPGYSRQWQVAGQWIRDNVALDAVFGHWWDYGYWVQNGGQRATMLDGANSIVYWNYLMGRHVLGGKTQEEALKVLKVHNVSHYLIIKDEIGKYTAYSSIGSDENYDRYSWITTFNINPKRSTETRTETIYYYDGGYVLDDDFTYEDVIYPKQSAGIAAILFPVENVPVVEGNSTHVQQKIGQPKGILVHQGRQVEVPIECLFINGQMIKYDNPGLKGCFRIVPSFGNDGKIKNPIAAGLYVSEEGINALWTNLFLFDQKNEDFDTSAFKLVYSDDVSFPLALIGGRLWGPLKIWEIEYPDDLNLTDEDWERYSDSSMKYLPDYFFDV